MVPRRRRAAAVAVAAVLGVLAPLTACTGSAAEQVNYAVDGTLITYNTNTVTGAASAGPQAFARVLTGFTFHGPDGQALADHDFGSVSAPQYGIISALAFVAFAYLGGITSVTGAMFGGLIVTDGLGKVMFKGVPSSAKSIADLASRAQFQYGRTIAGRGAWMKPKSPVDPETGAMDPDSTEAHACTVAEVEVDTETGVVTVLSIRSAYEVGRQVNPTLVHGQIVGGAWMGMSHALYETTEPYYPARDHSPKDFAEYLMPGPAELPLIEAVVLEVPSANGPYGVKGVGEMTANSPIPAIVNAIYHACRVRVDSLPVTPEKILNGLRDKAAAGGAA